MKSNSLCPVCGTGCIRQLFENHIALFKCEKCGIIFNEKHHKLKYENDYFTVQYKKQYGKTYAEDFDNIYNTSAKRLKKILKYIKYKNVSDLSLLDIGSALGFFLKAAKDSGINALSGIEISGFAAKYCEEEFGIKTINISFPENDIARKFDIITAWYFLEHTNDPPGVIKRIHDSLNKNGILAFSVPSIFGPQYIFRRKEWFASHPADHRMDFSPSSVKKILKKTGFRKVRIFPGGMHPERMLSKNSLFFPLFSSFYLFFSQIAAFSDTIEVYAVK